ncbi:C6 transcription factor [Xylogone sp. PMI_703]|nr:C6 transcription factor [Xylogone sp. PMI_703]
MSKGKLNPSRMQRRQFHNKSRRGCQSCKKRHVKCDEQGPPCANCVARKVECVYTSRSSPESSGRDSPSSSQVSVGGRGSNELADHSPRCSPNSLEVPCEFRRLLELDLMHRWSTSTWKSFCSVPDDHDYIQNVLPRDALRHSYLLNGIFAMTALDMFMHASCRSPSIYLQAALEYSDRSSSAFRDALSAITSENLHLLYLYSVISAAFNLVIPQCLFMVSPEQPQPSMLERVTTFSNLLLGAINIATTDWTAFMDSPVSIRATFDLLQTTSLDFMGDDERHALRLLGCVLDEAYPEIDPDDNTDRELSSDGENVRSPREMYQTAFTQLQLCFAEDARGAIQGLSISMPNTCGRDYVAAMSNEEPLVLLFLMYWGVLFERFSSNAWWAQSVGRILIMEVSDTLIQSSLSAIPEARQGMLWTRQQVGLEPLVWQSREATECDS